MLTLEEFLMAEFDMDISNYWQLDLVNDIAPDGRVLVGTGWRGGAMEGWMLSLWDAETTDLTPAVPEPQTLALIGAGLVALGAGLGRRRGGQPAGTG